MEESADRNETPKERADRELRVVLPGVTVLFAFHPATAAMAIPAARETVLFVIWYGLPAVAAVRDRRAR